MSKEEKIKEIGKKIYQKILSLETKDNRDEACFAKMHLDELRYAIEIGDYTRFAFAVAWFDDAAERYDLVSKIREDVRELEALWGLKDE